MNKSKTKNKKNVQGLFKTNTFSPKKTSFLILIFTLILITGMSSFLYTREQSNEKTVLMISEHKRIEVMHEHINSVLDTFAADLHITSTHADLNDYINKGEKDALNDLSNEYLQMSTVKKIYDQIRFIDSDGMETIRINYNENNPYIVDSKNLQDKKGRYYFEKTFNIQPGDIYMSLFDLNIENGNIEQPLKPMIRFGTPIVDDNKNKQGIILFNFLGNKLLESMNNIYQDEDSTLLFIDQDGFWVKGMNARDEWGFMYKDKNNKQMSISHPDLWQDVSRNHKGQIETADGLFTYTRIHPLNYINKAKLFEKNTPIINNHDLNLINEEYAWVILSFVPNKRITPSADLMLTKLIFVDIVLFIIISMLAWRLNIIMRYRRRAEKTIIELNELMRIINKMLRHDVLGKLGLVRICLEASELIKKNEMITDAYQASLEGIEKVHSMRELEDSFSVDKIMEKYNLRKIIKKIAQEQNIKVRIAGDANVMADNALHSVFENIIRNAKIHGGVTSLNIKIEKKDKVIIRISDKGNGIDKKIIESIFEEGVKSENTGNTGIGLYVTKKTINRYGGSIRAEENHPKGAIFIIEFPV